ncbi:hypothetical protein BGW41_000202 [Actinomortierella wolfii]|nr:hypothetical protein BGW41_000202 [Actinomortierella wolfii]
MKPTSILKFWVLVATTLIATFYTRETSAVVIALPVPDNNPRVPNVVIRSSHEEGPAAVRKHSQRLIKRGGRKPTGYVPGGTGSGNQYDKGKPYGRSLDD